jgi:hypothetical protein
MWTEIVSQIAALLPGVLASVNPPAAPDAIDALEHRIGAPLPDGFKQYLAVMDGQNDLGRDHPLIGFNRFLPVARVIETMDMQRSHFGDEGRIEWVASRFRCTRNRRLSVWRNWSVRQPTSFEGISLNNVTVVISYLESKTAPR